MPVLPSFNPLMLLSIAACKPVRPPAGGRVRKRQALAERHERLPPIRGRKKRKNDREIDCSARYRHSAEGFGARIGQGSSQETPALAGDPAPYGYGVATSTPPLEVAAEGAAVGQLVRDGRLVPAQ
jgi:hypothetical protein